MAEARGWYGTVSYPSDLGPAIAALSEEARQYMYSQLEGREPGPDDIARAADWDEQRKVG